MANTYHQIYLQTIFAVKYRDAVINKEWIEISRQGGITIFTEPMALHL